MEEDEMEVKDNYIPTVRSKFRVFPEDLLIGFGVLFLFAGFGIMFLPIIMYTPDKLIEIDSINYIVSGCIVFTLSCGMFYMSTVLKYLRKIIKINEERRE